MVCSEAMRGEPDVWSASDGGFGRSTFVVDSEARGGRSRLGNEVEIATMSDGVRRWFCCCWFMLIRPIFR